MNRRTEYFIMIFILTTTCVIWMNNLTEKGKYMEFQQMTPDSAQFRKCFGSDSLDERKEYLSAECIQALKYVESDAKIFPIPRSMKNKMYEVSFIDSWMAEREYNGPGYHEGTDIMAEKNIAGWYPVVSMTDGVVVNKGWLEKGGYRIGIAGKSGVYYYYAHLDSFADIEEGEEVRAGELIGFMGSTGYGEEGTEGKFPVHLHLGIYFYHDGVETSVNPFYILKMLEKEHRLIMK